MATEVYRPQFVIEEEADVMARRALVNLESLITEDPFSARDLLLELPDMEAIVKASLEPLYPKYHRDRLIGSLASMWTYRHDAYLGFDDHTEALFARNLPDRPDRKRFQRISLYVANLATWTETEQAQAS